MKLEGFVLDTHPAKSISKHVEDCSAIQTYGLSDQTIGNDFPVVVAIGINYTQSHMGYPRKVEKKIEVKDKLSRCRSFIEDTFLNGYCKDQDMWVEFGAASSNHIKPPKNKEFHLIMTNFCLWITNLRWMRLEKEIRSELLKNNPLFDGRPTEGPNWPHLQRLYTELADDPGVLWVAHGMNSEVFDLFDQFKSQITLHSWLKAPNLSYPYCGEKGSHYDRCFPRHLKKPSGRG